MSTKPPHTLSPTVKNRIARSSPAVRVAFTCADLAVEAFRRDFARRLDAPTAPVDGPRPRAIGVGQLVRAVGLEIEELGHRLVAADVACRRAQARQRGPRGRRDLAVRRLRGELISLRRTVTGLLGAEGAARWWRFLGGATARAPYPLLRQGQVAAAVLADSDSGAAPLPAVPGVTIDWHAAAARLWSLCAELEGALRAVSAGRREVTAARRTRQRMLAHFEDRYLRGARLLETLLDLAGLPTLAEQVRPGVGRRGRPPRHRPEDRHPELVAAAHRRWRGDSARTATMESGSEPTRTVEPAAKRSRDGDGLPAPPAKSAAPSCTASRRGRKRSRGFCNGSYTPGLQGSLPDRNKICLDSIDRGRYPSFVSRADPPQVGRAEMRPGNARDVVASVTQSGSRGYRRNNVSTLPVAPRLRVRGLRQRKEALCRSRW